MPAQRFTRRALLFAMLLPSTFGLAQSTLSPPPPLPDGVRPQVAQAIDRGLKHLASIQEADGSFGASPGQPDIYPVAVTGLVGLAFLAHGDTPTRGQYADIVNKITTYLLSTSSERTKGLFTTNNENEPNSRKGPRPMYGHAFAMTFLAHVYGQEGDLARRDQIRLALKRGILLTQQSQSPDGGWAYRANFYEDEGTLTVTQLQALRSCRDAGINVSRGIIDKGIKFIENSSNDDGSVRYRVQSDEVRPGVTCAGFVALWNAGQYESDRLKRIESYINRYIRNRWGSSKHAEYVEYYLAQAKWIMGGSAWADYYKTASLTISGLQESDGSWEGEDSDRYGATFSSAVALLVLQLPYNRLTVYQR